mmetsp:Transcript_11143/g.34881  ORF Transcript_11143/g.34881 Transcript_11143/m.34881 type:complete len:322 (-) Transcript_11143:484-1449(-)
MRGRASCRAAGTALLAAAAVSLLALPGLAQDDDFEYFRCDACSATFFKINKTLVERHGRRAASLQSFEFIEILEETCNTAFTKEEFGVKQHEGKKYLFGPGVTDHIPDKGFGQMGMGDYDKRLTSYCRMFTEEVGEEELHRIFIRDGGINRTALCLSPCSSAASGTGALSAEPRKPKRRPPPQQAPAASSSSSRRGAAAPRGSPRARRRSSDGSSVPVSSAAAPAAEPAAGARRWSPPAASRRSPPRRRSWASCCAPSRRRPRSSVRGLKSSSPSSRTRRRSPRTSCATRGARRRRPAGPTARTRRSPTRTWPRTPPRWMP